MSALCLGLFCGGSTLRAQTIPVLVYHRFDPAVSGPTTVRTAIFELQLAWLADHHYQVLPLHAAIDRLHTNKCAAGSLAVAITVDDGHRSVYTEMFPLILKHHIPVTLFIYPSAISNASYALSWEQIRKMQASGLVEVQSHTYWHPNFRKERARLSDAEYEAFVAAQLTRSKDVLQSKLGTRVDALAWPFGIYDPIWKKPRSAPAMKPHSHLKEAQRTPAVTCLRFHEYQFPTGILGQSSPRC